jgi:hypothetical protein
MVSISSRRRNGLDSVRVAPRYCDEDRYNSDFR